MNRVINYFIEGHVLAQKGYKMIQKIDQKSMHHMLNVIQYAIN
jgi:hypothetical protein